MKKQVLRRSLLVAWLCLNASGRVWAGPLDIWTRQTAGLPQGNDFVPEAVAYGNGVFVAVGGTWVASSADGVNWNAEQSVTLTQNPFVSSRAGETTTNTLEGIAFGDGRFVAYGYATGAIEVAYGQQPVPMAATSTDGVNWTGVNLDYPGGNDIIGPITYGNGEFILGDSAGSLPSLSPGPGLFVAVAPDGVNWGEYGVTGMSGGFDFNGDDYYAEYNSAFAFGYVNNGTTTTPMFAAANINSAVEKLFTSPDSFNWTARSPQFAQPFQVFYVNGLWLVFDQYQAQGAQSVFTSSDFNSWLPGINAMPEPSGYIQPVAMAYGGGNIVAVSGVVGTIVSAPWSTGPLTWTERSYVLNNGDPAYQLVGITYGNGVWVAVGSAMGTTPNGNTAAVILTCGATASHSSKTSGTVKSIVGAILAQDGVILAVGDGGTVLRSANGGQTWTAPTLAGLLSTNFLNAITQTSDDTYIAVGAGGVITLSPDGVNWSSVASGVTNTLTGVAAGNGLEIAVAADGTVLTSTNETNWTRQALIDTNGLSSITFGNGQFEAVGTDGVLLLSTNGVNWTINKPALPSTAGNLKSISFTDGEFSAVDVNGDVLTTSNLLSWTTLLSGSGTGSIDNPNTALFLSNNLVLVGDGGSISTVQFPVAGTGTDQTLNGIAYNGQIYVAVGEQGAIIESGDGGGVWASPTNYFGTPNSLYAVAYGNGQFVGVGQNSWIVTSPDGNNWNSTSSGVNAQDLNAIAYGNGKFVAVGDQGAILSSSDGLNWTVQTNGVNDNFYAIVFSHGQFVMTGVHDSFTSSDGIVWTAGGNGLDGGLEGLATGNGLLVAISSYGEIYTSTDGLNWAPQASPNSPLYGVAFGGGLFIASTSAGVAYVSPNGTNWTEIQTGENGLDLNAVVGGNSEFVLVGEGGTSVSAAYDALASLPQATTWNVVQTPTSGYDTFYGAAYNGQVYTIVGSTPASDLASADGINWSAEGIGLENLANTVIWGDGVFVEVDYYGNIYTSPDGTNWTQRAGTSTGLYAVAYGGGAYVAASGNGAVYTSPDSIHWSPHHTGLTAPIDAVTYGNGQFVLVAEDGTAATSANGTSWTTNSTPSPRALWGVTYGNNQYVAVGDDGVVLTSADGLNWTWQTNAPSCVNRLSSVAWGNNEFMAVGQGGWTFKSRDGTNWISTSSATVNDLYSVIFAKGSFIAVGSGNTLIETPGLVASHLGSIAIMPNGTVQVSVNGTSGSTYNIEYSTDMMNWQPLTTLSLVNTNGGQFIDRPDSPLVQPNRFYRVVVAP